MSGPSVSLIVNKVVRIRSPRFILLSFCMALGLAGPRPAQAQVTETILHNFSWQVGEHPLTTPIQGLDRAYYGTAQQGGQYGDGTIYRIDSTGTLSVLHEFTGSDGLHAYGGLVQGSDSTLYGTAVDGGANNLGTVYKLNPDGTGFKVLHNFAASDGAEPLGALIIGSDGMLYGVTHDNGPSYTTGTVFQMSTDGSVFHVLHNFTPGTQGSNPDAGVIQGRDGMLYGTTSSQGGYGYGTVFQLSTDGSVFVVIHNFTNGADGSNPSGGLIQGSGSDNSLYGTTYNGGSNGEGTVFQMATDGSFFNTIHNFNGADGANPYNDESLIQGSDGMLYGTTVNGGADGYGTVFQVSTNGTIFNILHSFYRSTDGQNPYGGVIQGSDGLLHGVTPSSPDSSPLSYGTLFSLPTNGSSFTTTFDFFWNGFDGGFPGYGSLTIGKDGSYYGTTVNGGMFEYGILYKITPSGKVSILHNFGGTDGAYPEGGIIFDSKGNLYGTAKSGGTSGYGVVFEYTPATGVYTLLYNFTGADGSYPFSRVLLIGSSLYGVTYEGGIGYTGPDTGNGVVYKITLPTSTKPLTFHVLHSFAGGDGANPFGPLIEGSDKNLYGTTLDSGPNGYGTVFKISPTKGVLTTLHSFNGSDGAAPFAGVIQGSDGMLYGTTWSDDTNSTGTVYQISTNGSVFNTLHRFDGSGGAHPYAGLLQGSDGMLYGTTEYGGANGDGTAFNLNTTGSVFNVLYNFFAPGTDSSNPVSGFVEGKDGNMYAAASYGGIINSGTVYRLNTLLPLISSFSPISGSASAGTTVTLKGVNLGSASTVTIAGVSQTILSKAATSVKFNLNASTPTGSYPIVVTTPKGTATSAKKFTITT